MARGINKVILVGHLGADPEVRYFNDGKGVANVSLATAETWKDKETGQKQERTEWHRVVFYGPLAEIVKEYLRKGSQIYVEGRLQTRKWQGQDGQNRYSTEVVASDMQMLGSRGQSPGNGNDARASANSPAPASDGGSFNEGPPPDFDDAIPF